MTVDEIMLAIKILEKVPTLTIIFKEVKKGHWVPSSIGVGEIDDDDDCVLLEDLDDFVQLKSLKEVFEFALNLDIQY
jgi:hypothetical protein